MAKATNPTTFSHWFEVDPVELDRLGVLDPTPAIDTKLFIDPLLLKASRHSEMNDRAAALYRDHFEQVIKFLARTKNRGDLAWRTARRLFDFHEIRGTCLGYGAGSIAGSGLGPQLSERLLTVGKEIVDLGIEDPDLFQAMALFEAGIGPDRISDMTTNIIKKALVAFNRRILSELSMEGEEFLLGSVVGEFLPNPFQERRTPIILVPWDILRHLPIANDWDEVANAAAATDFIRQRVNQHISHIWAEKTRRDKDVLRQEATASKAAFKTLLDAIHSVPIKPYDVGGDPIGLISWSHLAESYAKSYPIDLPKESGPPDLEYVYRVVQRIVVGFRHLIEERGLSKELYKEDGRPRHESTAQRLFFAVAYSYCKANNLDVSPEIDVGTGKIDFKFSSGFVGRVLVEVKLSVNGKLVAGYEKQLESYKEAEETGRAIYLIVNVGGMGKKLENIVGMRNTARSKGRPLSDVELIDGSIKPTASKR